MKSIFSKVKTAPLGFIKRGLYKTIVGPIVYGQGDDYDAGKYWSERFSKYGQSLQGVGNEGISEKENERAYAEAAKIFLGVCRREHIDFQNARVLEIGCGSGFYTQILYDLGVKKYLGVDITDVLFPELQNKFPQFEFSRKDITSDKIEGDFDLIVMIDVIEHIVKCSKFTAAMNNVKSCLAPSGVFVVAPLVEVERKELFYVNFWGVDNLKPEFNGYDFGGLVPFRNGYILTVRNS